MNPRRLAMVWAGLGREVVLPACVLVCLGVLGLAGSENTGAPPIMDRVAPSLAANAEIAVAPQPSAIRAAAGRLDTAVVVSESVSEPTQPTAASQQPEPIVEATITDPEQKQPSETPPVRVAALDPESIVEPAVTGSTQKPPSEAPPVQVAMLEPEPVVEAALTDSTEKLPSETPPVQSATPSAPDQPSSDAQNVNSIEIVDECWAVEVCVDRYLWALYQRTPKEDTIKVQDQTRVTVKRKGKLVTVTRTSTRVVDEDFAWKDPKAADKASMPMADYVIGGMDSSFKLKLFHVLHAAEEAGLSPGITSAFRDDYRQSIASGLKAANDRSYHGGSFRGGYGHGLAADIVSVSGATRAQRQASSEILWKWVDTHGREFGVGRPYLDRDPPHVGPIDGNEYISRRGTKHQETASKPEKRKRVAAR